MTPANRTREPWLTPPIGLMPPARDEVHLWRARATDTSQRDWSSVLSADESERARRFRDPKDRALFTVTRGVLRTVLGDYLGLSPEALKFTCNEAGKPFIEASEITFNVSHSGELALLAFGSGVDLGVDIEHLEIARNVSELAKRVLSRSSHEQLEAMPAGARKKEFLKIWTQREAVGKALGIGVSMENEFELSSVTKETGWSVLDIDAAENYVATLAVRTPGIEVHLLQYPP